VVARDVRGRALRLAGTNADIEHRKRLELELAHRAAHDALTGLPNRNLFHDRIERALARSRRNRSLMALMYVDIDHFKGVNDSHGHDAGDALLRAFAQRVGKCIRETDTAARLGGDEFAVILEALEDRVAGERIAGEIVAAMRPEFDLGEHRLRVSTSVGLAFYDGAPGVESASLIRLADEALYGAKAAGRDTWRASGDAAASAAPD
jgi:diguanylate cyclase (GGDEF)-like protein